MFDGSNYQYTEEIITKRPVVRYSVSSPETRRTEQRVDVKTLQKLRRMRKSFPHISME